MKIITIPLTGEFTCLRGHRSEKCDGYFVETEEMVGGTVENPTITVTRQLQSFHCTKQVGDPDTSLFVGIALGTKPCGLPCIGVARSGS